MFRVWFRTVWLVNRYIAPEQVPVQYGGLSREGEFTTTDAATEEIIKPATKHTVEFPVSEVGIPSWFHLEFDLETTVKIADDVLNDGH